MSFSYWKPNFLITFSDAGFSVKVNAHNLYQTNMNSITSNIFAVKCAIVLTHAFLVLWKITPYKSLLINVKKSPYATTTGFPPLKQKLKIEI
jgi:hypothetical protein